MANYNEIYPEIIKAEGGYANNINDRGGETYKGISRKHNPDWDGWKIIDEYKKVNGPLKTNQTIDNKFLDTLVKYRYFKKYWEPVRGKEIENTAVAHIIFDGYVNQGNLTKSMLKEALKNIGNPVNVDSIPLKEEVIKAVNTVDPKKFIYEYKNQREKRYRDRAANVAGQSEFLKGWLNRLSKFETSEIIEIVKANKKKTIIVFLSFTALITGIYFYFKNK